ncbi:flavin reductase family protein [Pandoraea cepalis]|uniref:Flavin reductase family protein n=1 Tax=Pandoraea cepalis TaxID=2508294 RepID=A0AAW7MN99_9BURK|nr:flavin reductase family protein [Pandoraea cepalis]MDN4574116.1 flavin reductase family protein [Pandoraea cepalis]MDN4579619.1 flavin reductase family protein [Pandoraea cepalis]
MKHVSMAGLSEMQRYWLITGSVGPRPIALVTSLSAKGHCNAAPFSAFNYMAEDPPLFAVAIVRYGEESHRVGEEKDTLVNIRQREEFVVNMVDESILDAAVKCGSDFPAHASELDSAGLTLAPSTSVAVPRVAESPISWECRLYRMIDLSQQRAIVFGEIVAMNFRDDLLDESRLRVNVDKFAPVGRLGGPNYCTTTTRRRIPVPTYFANSGKPRE